MDFGNDFVLLESENKEKGNSRSILFKNPVDIICARRKTDLQDSFEKINQYLRKGFYLAGFFSYECGYDLELSLNIFSRDYDYPRIWFGVYECPLKQNKPYISAVSDDFYVSMPVLETGYDEYKKNIKIIKELIARGETYQINYTSGYSFTVVGDIISFYASMKKHQKVQYSALINFGKNYIASLSPELFFRIDKKRNISMKPMKGTAANNASPAWLSGDEKNISENVMIVDMLRNDLGKICIPGSVTVKSLYDVEKYETLLQMTSTISARLSPDAGMNRIWESLFPCGSVTGAPKISSMKIINKLEGKPRGIYTGAIGYFAPDGTAAFNVAIRTIDLRYLEKGKYAARMGTGSGIVYDSRAREEYRECQIKAGFLFQAIPDFALIETMFVDNGRIKYLSMHLRRLMSSARYFNIRCDAGVIKSELRKYAASLKGKKRLRLLLKTSGKIKLEHKNVNKTPCGIGRTTFSKYKTDSNNPFLYHKTTFRILYDSEYNKYSARGCEDVIFCNEKNQITEGAISNLFVCIKG